VGKLFEYGNWGLGNGRLEMGRGVGVLRRVWVDAGKWGKKSGDGDGDAMG
jgi:hypothetical protein